MKYLQVKLVTYPLKIILGEYECAICHETGNLKDWKKHAMGKHYNVAWMAGDMPIVSICSELFINSLLMAILFF